MFALDVQALAVGLGSIVVAFVAVIVFACIRAAGLAERYLESVAGQFGFPGITESPTRSFGASTRPVDLRPDTRLVPSASLCDPGDTRRRRDPARPAVAVPEHGARHGGRTSRGRQRPTRSSSAFGDSMSSSLI